MEIKDHITTFEELKDTYSTYISDTKDLELIQKAYLFAKEKHEGQFRKSGDPYITHCLGVAEILAELHVGPQTIIAGLLHDTVEDTTTTIEEISDIFGKEVAQLVDGLTKVTRLSDYKNVEFTAENHRKIFVAMAKDVRVIIVKLADRLHNMRTLAFQPQHKQERISKETLEVYSPIAHRLGLYKIQTELEDTALYYLENEKYKFIEKKLNELISDAKGSCTKLKNELIKILKPTKIPFEIKDRVKSIYSIYKKMYIKHHSFEEIYDIMALRIITKTEQNCYETLGYVHANFKPVPGRFKDYIAMPKPNMYQSLHTTIITDTGHMFEIQIRTSAMDELAESGVAAHWRYKEGTSYDAKKEQVEIENQLHWFKDFVSMSSENDNKEQNAKDYVETLSHDIFDANVYVFTPKGKVICLPNGSTPIDFAYRIHSDIGEHVSGSKVNNVLVPLSTTLKTGDVVEVITSKNSSPNSEWVNIAKTNFAKNKIRKYLMKQNADYLREDNIKKGRQGLNDALRERKLNIDITKVITKKVLETFKCQSVDDVLNLIGNRNIMPFQVIDASDSVEYDARPSAQQMADHINQKKMKKNTYDAVVLQNGDSVLTSLAACCQPIPGDEIIGFVSTGQGVKVHRKDCVNITKSDESRLIAVKWNLNSPKNKNYPVDLAVQCQDRNGLLIDVLNCLNAQNAQIFKVNAKYHPSNSTTTINLTLLVADTQVLAHYINAIYQVKSVYRIDRVTH